MSTRTPSTDFDASLYRQASENLGRKFPATDWLSPLRGKALARFSNGGFPTIRDEDWRYTSLKRVARRSSALLHPASQQEQSAEHLISSSDLVHRILPGLAEITMVFVNGMYQPDLSSAPAPDSGLIISTLGALKKEEQSSLLARLETFTGTDDCRVNAFSTAFLTDGLVIDVLAGATVSAPVYVVFLNHGNTVGSHPRILMRLAANSSASLVEHHLSETDSLTSGITQIECADHASLTYLKLQQEHDSAFHLASQHISLAKDSSVQAINLDLGAGLSRNGLTVHMNGEHAEARLHGLFIANGTSHIDNHTLVEHKAPNTQSSEVYRGVIDNRGRGVFNGRIVVHQKAQKTNAQLTNANLLLSPGAEIDTKPELEIYADDVKCSHGSTVGRIDNNALFYLRARGIPEDEAKQLVIRAFGNEIVMAIPIPQLHEPVTDLLTARLEQSDDEPGLSA